MLSNLYKTKAARASWSSQVSRVVHSLPYPQLFGRQEGQENFLEPHEFKMSRVNIARPT